MNLKQIVAAMPTAQTIVLPGDWFERLPDNVSVYDTLYRWLIQSRGVEPTRLHNRTYVGAALAKRLRTAERRRIGRRHKLRGENLEKALNWSDLGSGPLTMFGEFEIVGDALFIVHKNDELEAEKVAGKLFDEYRIQKNREHRQIASGANFGEWLTSNSERDDIVGDLAKDVLRDPKFPGVVRHYQEAFAYLQAKRACQDALDALADAWLEYAYRYKNRMTKTAWCAVCEEQITDFSEGYLIVADDSSLDCCHRDCIDEPSSPMLPLVELLKIDWINVLVEFAERHHVPASIVADSERLFQLWGFGLDDDAPRTTVYFIQAGTTGLIKIGYSGGQALKRLATLQTGSSEPLRLLAEVEGTRDTEAELHRRFATFRRSGEWFEPHPELIAYISVVRSDCSGN